MTSFVEGGFFTSSGNPSPPSKSLHSNGFSDGKIAYYHRDEKSSPTYKRTDEKGKRASALPPLTPGETRSLALVSTGGVGSHDNGWGDGPSPPVASMLDGEDDFLGPMAAMGSTTTDEAGISSSLRQRKRNPSYSMSPPVDFRLQTQWCEWVIVYGFPEAAIGAVLNSFQCYGEIVEQRAASQGNWFFLRYATRLQAEKAVVSGNGSVLSGSVMVGCKRVDAGSSDQLSRATAISLASIVNMNGELDPSGTRGHSISTPAKLVGGGASLEYRHRLTCDIDDSDLLEDPRYMGRYLVLA